MGIFSNFFDRFKAADFEISHNQKLKTIQEDFKRNFGLSLRVYKGKMLADPDLTFAQLNQRTSKKVQADSGSLKVKANMTIGDFEKLIDEHFGLTVQVANEFNTYCVSNSYTIGQASRKEDLLNWCKLRGHKSIEAWLESEGFDSLEDYYNRNSGSETDNP
jgi:hypothetical protein